MKWLSDQWEQMRGNVKWDIVKAILAIALSALYVLLQNARHLAWDWGSWASCFFFRQQCWHFFRYPQAGDQVYRS